MQLDHHLDIGDDGRVRCRRCGQELGDTTQNFKDHAVSKTRPIEEANPLIVDPRTFIDDTVVFRQYFCPGCATLLENEVVLESSAPVWDKQVDATADVEMAR
jgi:acetone carboxylase gamma subunit